MLQRELFRVLTLFYPRGLGLVVLNALVVQPYGFFVNRSEYIFACFSLIRKIICFLMAKQDFIHAVFALHLMLGRAGLNG
jgi:hypothetical protein